MGGMADPELLPHLVPPEVVHRHHAGQVQHHAQALEGRHGEPQGAGFLHCAGRVVPAEGAALAARQALAGQVWGFFSAGALLLTWRRWNITPYSRLLLQRGG